MVKLRNSYVKFTEDGLKSRAELHCQKMNDVLIYSMFQILVTQLDGLVTTYRAALIMAKMRGEDRTRAKNKAKAAVIDCLTALVKAIEAHANTLPEDEAEEFVSGTGADLVTAPTTTKKVLDFLPAPIGFQVLDNKAKKGGAFFSCNKVTGALMYAFEHLDKDARWVHSGFSDLPTIALSDFPSGSVITFRVRAIGPNNLTSEYSESFTVWVS